MPPKGRGGRGGRGGSSATRGKGSISTKLKHDDPAQRGILSFFGRPIAAAAAPLSTPAIEISTGSTPCRLNMSGSTETPAIDLTDGSNTRRSAGDSLNSGRSDHQVVDDNKGSARRRGAIPTDSTTAVPNSSISRAGLGDGDLQLVGFDGSTDGALPQATRNTTAGQSTTNPEGTTSRSSLAVSGSRDGRSAAPLAGRAGFVRASDLLNSRHQPQHLAADGIANEPPDGQPTPASGLEKSLMHEVTPVSVANVTPSTCSVSKIRNTGNATVKSKGVLSSWGSLGNGGVDSTGRGSSWTGTGAGRQQQQQRRHPTIQLPLHIVGLQFRETFPAQSKVLNSGDQKDDNGNGNNGDSGDDPAPNTPLELEREPDNAHDMNAIKVLLPAPSPSQGRKARFLGYIPGRVAVLLAGLLDATPGEVARVSLKTVDDSKDEGGGGGVDATGIRQTLPALLEVQPLGRGAERSPYAGLILKLREAVTREEKRQRKRKSEIKAHKERLRSKQKTLLLDFGRSASIKDGASSAAVKGSERGGSMLESMPWEVLWEIFCSPGISSRELFGPIRGVCSNWLKAIDGMPCATARRQVARVCAGQPATRVPSAAKETTGSSQYSRPFGAPAGVADVAQDLPSSDPGHDRDHRASDESLNSEGISPKSGISPQSQAVDKAAIATVTAIADSKDPYARPLSWWDTVRARLARGEGFTECHAEDVLQRLEWAAALEGDGSAMARVTARVMEEEGMDSTGAGAEAEGDDDSGQREIPGELSCSEVRRDRMLNHVKATRALCVEWGLIQKVLQPESGGTRAQSGGQASETGDRRKGGYRMVNEGAHGRTAGGIINHSSDKSSHSISGVGRHGGSGGVGRVGGGSSWSGWEALSLAVVTSSSEDRLSLCCWAIRPLMGGGGGRADNGRSSTGKQESLSSSSPRSAGLPRGEVIELLCLLLCALRSLEADVTILASPVAGSMRLKADLLVCARVLENWDVRFAKPKQSGEAPRVKSRSSSATSIEDHSKASPSANPRGAGGASGLIANLTAEQRSIVLADVKPGKVLTVLAFAGTGKTTCLRAYAQARPHLRILYLTFNVSVREEAEKTFPPHTDCKGVHQMAFRHVGRRFQNKLSQDLKESDIQTFLRRKLGERVKLSAAAMVLRTLSSWFASDAPALSPSHVRPPPEDLATKQEAARSTSAAQGTSDVDSDNNDSNGDESDASSDDDALGDNNRGRHRAESISTAPPASSASAPEVREGGMLSPARGARRRSSPVSEETILAWAKLAWTAMQVTSVAGRRGSGQRGWSGQAEEDADPTLCMTHAGYLKLFQLARPCLSRTYDVIMLDEAQDSNPCIASIVLRETACARILVGDSHQAIYGFIGAEDHLKRVAGGDVRHLTQVFRFDQSIAHVANSLVGLIKQETRPLLGSPGTSGQVLFAHGTGLNVWHPAGCRVKRPMAFLARTVATLVRAAMHARSQGEKVAWVGGAQAYSLEAVEDMCFMAMGQTENIRNPLLKRLKSMKALIKFIQEAGDRQWSSRVRMLEGKDPKALLSDLRELQRTQVDPKHADTILSTVHKAKGLEFDTVVLADDFIEVDTIPWAMINGRMMLACSSPADTEEVNILYVAVTRAKRLLVLNHHLRIFLEFMGAWNSVSLRGVATHAGEGRSSLPSREESLSAGVKCAGCGRDADAQKIRRPDDYQNGGRTEGGREFSYISSDSGAADSVRLLYAESGTNRALCSSCVERETGLDDDVYDDVQDWLAPAGGRLQKFTYARVLMRLE